MGRPRKSTRKSPPTRPVLERFMEKVDVRGPNECWVWLAGRHPRGGYGQFTAPQFGSAGRAHRVSYQLHVGPIPPGMVVRHTCDNPPCVNPAHLAVGTVADNVHDMHERRRVASFAAEANPRAKLTAAQVQEIRDRRAAGERNVDLAREFGVCKTHISRIVTRGAWT